MMINKVLPVMSDCLLDILDVAPDVLREGLDCKKVVKLNVTGVFYDEVYPILLLLKQALLIIHHLHIPDLLQDWIFAQLESIFIRRSSQASYLIRPGL